MNDDREQLVVTKAAVRGWLERVLASHTVVGPTAETEHVTGYRVLGPETQLRLDGVRPTASPKAHFLPQTETLFVFRGSGPALALTATAPETAPTVVFGVRPCDARALARLDDVFLARTERDLHYEARRRTTVLIGLACAAPSWGCFCTSVGGAPGGTEGLDLLLTDLGDRYHVAILTPAGRDVAALAEATAATEAESDAARAQHAQHLGHGHLGPRRKHMSELAQHDIEGSIGKRQRLGIAFVPRNIVMSGQCGVLPRLRQQPRNRRR